MNANLFGASGSKVAESSRKTCRTCRWWDTDGQPPGIGVCHGGPPGFVLLQLRHPITGETIAQGQGHWPPVGADDYCRSHDPVITAESLLAGH